MKTPGLTQMQSVYNATEESDNEAVQEFREEVERRRLEREVNEAAKEWRQKHEVAIFESPLWRRLRAAVDALIEFEIEHKRC